MVRHRFNKTTKFRNSIEHLRACIMAFGQGRVTASPANVMQAARQTATEILWLVVRTDHIA
ncbi:MAG: hypothetical protein CMJ70_11475 [Planctomycetaceae bacterium]|nr:hypothetical protein [Planctomycetaceae bacterium]HAA70918.1 hypothetical protein [Planctomycetaceae bacterium]